MKKFINLALIFCLIVSTMIFAGCKTNQESAKTTNIRIVALGDSISAGYAPKNTELYQYYSFYSAGRTKINEKCYTNLIANNIRTENTTVNAVSYAESGDTTSDLLEKFNDKKNYPDLLNDIKKANIVTVCIGANNVLQTVMQNLTTYMMGNVSLDELEAELVKGYENFKNDYTNHIIPILTRYDAQIYVMTIYDPYKYASFNDITITGSYGLDISEYEDSFITLKNLAISYLEKINDYIKTQHFDNVYVVDVHQEFEKLTKSQYSTYINVDTTKLSLKINSLLDIMNLATNIYLDPHPTLQGQEYIATLFETEIFKNNANLIEI